ncbi:MAG TPA: hypothetical protein VH081_03405 [Solirubrobacteraceae bacterium]|nr:hypothetical protein [Solirubrobacteraceae bacterium]
MRAEIQSIPHCRPLGRGGSLLALALVLAAALLAMQAPRAGAVILPAQTIDGPSEDIAGFGGVAMAEDGTGGLVYLKRIEGVDHVFVARYLDGHWLAPIRVDIEERFGASSPRIGAANGGELVVVWATPFATEHGQPVDELLGAMLGPGSSSFGQAMIVDPNILSGTGVSPDLAVSPTGQADVVYRVVSENLGQETSIPLLHAGDVVEQVRVAHFNGETWSNLGAVNRNPGVSMRAPTAANAPQVAIGPTGNGIVVWQEPEIANSGVARIWARRIFGKSLDYVLPVSATSIAGVPVLDDADSPTVAISRLGQAVVAYRQNVAISPLPGPRIMLNTLPDGESASGTEFVGAIVADSAVSGGRAAQIGAPSIDVDEHQNLRLLYDSNGTPRVIFGTDRGLVGAVSLGPGFVGSEISSASVMNPAGGGVSAWPSADPQGHPALAVREDFPEGAAQTGLISGGAGGAIGGLAVGRSGLGDGLVGFIQGPLGDAAIVATEVSAPPDQLVLTVPKGWVAPSQALVEWQPAPSANGPLSYRVVLNGQPLQTPAGAFQMRLNGRGVGSGSKRVQILATDDTGQQLLSAPSTLKIDGQAPTVTITRTAGNHAVRVRISDSGSGVAKGSVSVSFGDGAGGHGRAKLAHRYRRGGIYQLVVRARDKLGNAAVVRRLVSIA